MKRFKWFLVVFASVIVINFTVAQDKEISVMNIVEFTDGRWMMKQEKEASMNNVRAKNTFKEAFAFLENCGDKNIQLVKYDSINKEFIDNEYLNASNYKYCSLKGYEKEGFKVFCANESYYSLPVSKFVIPVDTDFMMIYGLVIDKPLDETYAQLVKENFKVKMSSKETSNDYGKAIVYKINNDQTMLYCEIPELEY